MGIKAIAFDVGHTLIHYNNHLNWQSLYPPAIAQVMKTCDYSYNEEADKNAQKILTKYNTRVNFRDYEVSSNIIFSEILNSWGVNLEKLYQAKKAFFAYFQKGAVCFDDTEFILQALKNKEIKIGILTDVAYGMDNEYALNDLEPIKKYIDICLTSTDVGYRKPNKQGYIILKKSFNVEFNQIAFVGDEEKDVIGANGVGMISILINRENASKNYSQSYTIQSLTEILELIDWVHLIEQIKHLFN